MDPWIIGDGPSSGRLYIVHIEFPRFVVEMIELDDGCWRPSEVKAIDLIPVEDVDSLMREAGDVFLSWIQVAFATSPRFRGEGVC